MITVKVYQKENRNAWNAFNTKSRNGLFIFDRSYLEYHSDRYSDFSLMFYDRDQLIGLLPANRSGSTLYSHAGLTFGGIVSDSRLTSVKMLEIFQVLTSFLLQHDFVNVIYKAIPYIFHDFEAQEDLYAIVKSGGQLIRRDLSSVINFQSRIPFSKSKKHGTKKAIKAGLKVHHSNEFDKFMRILEQAVLKHGARPTHTLEEISLLARNFQNNIRLFAAYEGNDMLAGVLVYMYRSVAHTQYMAATDKGREVGALDLIINVLIEEVFTTYKYFSFGISTEQNGLYLNKGLVSQKEMFGARAIVHDFYDLNLKQALFSLNENI